MAVNLPGCGRRRRRCLCLLSILWRRRCALFNPLMALVTKSGQQQQHRRFRQLWALRFWHSAKETLLPSLSALLIVIVILLPIELLSDGLAAVVCTCNLPQTATHTLPHTHTSTLSNCSCCAKFTVFFSQCRCPPSPGQAYDIYAACTACTLSLVYTKYIY